MFPNANLQPVIRCKADQWRVDHGLTITEMAVACGLKQPELSRCFYPVDHPEWREATLRIRKRVRTLTNGAVALDHWPEKPIPATEATALRHATPEQRGQLAAEATTGGASAALSQGRAA